MGIIKLICDRKEERVRQGRKVTAVDGRYFKLAGLEVEKVNMARRTLQKLDNDLTSRRLSGIAK